MKIVKESTWIGKELKCKDCGTIFKLEKKDVKKVASVVDDEYSVDCPACGTECYFK